MPQLKRISGKQTKKASARTTKWKIYTEWFVEMKQPKIFVCVFAVCIQKSEWRDTTWTGMDKRKKGVEIWNWEEGKSQRIKEERGKKGEFG